MSILNPNAIPDVAAEPPIVEEEQHEIHALGYWESVWRVFKRDKVAVGGGITILLLIFVSFAGGPIAQYFLGHDGNTPFLGGTTAYNGAPVGPWAHVSQLPGNQGAHAFFILGADSLVGRDEFLRLLYGGRTSLEIAVFSTIVTTLFGLLMGAAAGYFGGVVDVIVSRLTELVMAFPVLLFLIGIATVAGPQLRGITFGILPPGVFMVTAVFSIFGWFYPERIARAQILSLREKEFVEAARMTGASDWRIIRSHLLPHLVAPMIVISTLSVGGFVLGEAGLSFLGVGIKDPTS